jgi:DNA-binding NtrC family response regulator
MVKHIILIDDDPDDCWIFSKILAEINRDLTLTCCENCQELISHLEKSGSPDLIFLDLNMPGMDGMACLKKVRERIEWTSIPVIIYTTAADSKTIDDAIAAGAFRVYVKPVFVNDLKKILIEAIQMVDLLFVS